MDVLAPRDLRYAFRHARFDILSPTQWRIARFDLQLRSGRLEVGVAHDQSHRCCCCMVCGSADGHLERLEGHRLSGRGDSCCGRLSCDLDQRGALRWQSVRLILESNTSRVVLQKSTCVCHIRQRKTHWKSQPDFTRHVTESKLSSFTCLIDDPVLKKYSDAWLYSYLVECFGCDRGRCLRPATTGYSGNIHALPFWPRWHVLVTWRHELVRSRIPDASGEHT